MRSVSGTGNRISSRAFLLLLLALLAVAGLLAFHGAAAPPLADAAHGHVSSASEAPPTSDIDPLWPVCPAPSGHGDVSAGCGLGLMKPDVLADLAAAPAHGIRLFEAAPATGFRSLPARTLSLVELSISRT